MPLSEKLAENVRACFSGIWIESCEHEDAILEIGRLCYQENWKLATWDINQSNETSGADPLAAVRSLDSMATDDEPGIYRCPQSKSRRRIATPSSN